MNIATKKETGLADILKDYQPQQLEEQKKVVHSENVFVDLIERYRELKKLPVNTDSGLWLEGEPLYHQTKDVKTVLNKEELQAFLSMLIVAEEKMHPAKGILLNRLVQNSYDAGYNDFTLDHQSAAILHVGCFLVGQESNPLTLNVRKATGFIYATRAEYLSMNVEIEVFGYAQGVRNSSITILGGAAVNLGNKSFRSNFHVTGDMFNGMAEYARESCFYIGGVFHGAPIKKHWMMDSAPQQCTFKSPRPETIDAFLSYVPVGNTIIFINQDGKEEVVRNT